MQSASTFGSMYIHVLGDSITLFSLVQFCIMTLLALGMYVSSGGWSLWARSKLDQDLRANMEAAIVEYDTVPAYSAIWDELHRRVRKHTCMWTVCYYSDIHVAV